MIGKYEVRSVLRRLGIEWKDSPDGKKCFAHCPTGSHPDAHASWEIVATGPRSNLHLCRSCKWGGDVVTLVCLAKKFGDPREGEAFKAARSWLRGESTEAPAEVPKTIRVVVADPYERGFSLPIEVLFGHLHEWPTIPRKYLEDRGVTPAQVERHGLCYAVDGRLGGRIVIPTLTRGTARVASYAARSFVGEEPRYLTPHSREAPEKGVLFGEHTWSDESRVYVAEGAFNLLAVERAIGHVPLAGLSGSNVHPSAIVKLSSFADVVLVTDPDHAGEGATRKLYASFARHRTIRRVALPIGHDADSFARSSGVDALRDLLLAAS